MVTPTASVPFPRAHSPGFRITSPSTPKHHGDQIGNTNKGQRRAQYPDPPAHSTRWWRLDCKDLPPRTPTASSPGTWWTKNLPPATDESGPGATYSRDHTLSHMLRTDQRHVCSTLVVFNDLVGKGSRERMDACMMDTEYSVLQLTIVLESADH